MKIKIIQWLIFGCCVTLFVAFHIHGHFKNTQPTLIERYKPAVPAPLVVFPREHPFKEHPWLQLQPAITQITPEIESDLSRLQRLCQNIALHAEGELTEASITTSFIEHLLSLQESIPFDFPEHYYNVVAIDASPERCETPIPFEIHQRLHIGDNAFGMPIYLDVRVFELDGRVSAQEIINWHRHKLVGNEEVLCGDLLHQTYHITGERNPTYRDFSHGFSLGERILHLDCVLQEKRLYISHLGTSD